MKASLDIQTEKEMALQREKEMIKTVHEELCSLSKDLKVPFV
jgi:hypothetical protein